MSRQFKDEQDATYPHGGEDVVRHLEVGVLPEGGLEGDNRGGPLRHDHRDVHPVQVRLEEAHLVGRKRDLFTMDAIFGIISQLTVEL